MRRRPIRGGGRITGGLLAIVAIVMVGGLAATGFAMLYPVPFDNPLGIAALVALCFPLHLLVITALAVALAFIARRWRARLAVGLLAFAALLSGAMAVWPSIALWRFAHIENTGLSLGDYLADAAHLNLGTPQPARTVVYGVAADGTALRLDVWPASSRESATPRPALVRLHGGAFTHGNRSDMADWDRWFNELGYTVFDVDYRLPPPVRWLDEIGDVKCALGWVAAHAKDANIDPARISVIGFSAGATLAMLAAYSMGNPKLPPSCDAAPVKVRSVISLYGIPDMPRLYDTSPSRHLVHESSAQYIGGSPSAYPDRHAAVSPLTYIGPSSPPTIAFLGMNDRIVPSGQLKILDAALKQAGVVSQAYLLPATDHGFDVNWGGFATQIARAKIERFLQRYP
jgi:acetyl esterase/lipase